MLNNGRPWRRKSKNIEIYNTNNSELFRPTSEQTEEEVKLKSSFVKNRSIYASDNSYLSKKLDKECFTTEIISANNATLGKNEVTPSKNQHSKSYKLNFILQIFIVFQISFNFFVTTVSCDDTSEYLNSNGHYTRTWAVHIEGGDELAKAVAKDHNMLLKGKVRIF